MSGSLKGLCARTLVSSVVMLGRGGIFKREFSVRQLGYEGTNLYWGKKIAKCFFFFLRIETSSTNGDGKIGYSYIEDSK